MLVELTLGNGEPIYVNPQQVVSVQHGYPPGEGLCAIYLAQPSNGWQVRGTPAEVAQKLGLAQ